MCANTFAMRSQIGPCGESSPRSDRKWRPDTHTVASRASSSNRAVSGASPCTNSAPSSIGTPAAVSSSVSIRPPTRCEDSSTTTRFPARASSRAANNPAAAGADHDRVIHRSSAMRSRRRPSAHSVPARPHEGGWGGAGVRGCGDAFVASGGIGFRRRCRIAPRTHTPPHPRLDGSPAWWIAYPL